MGGHFSLPALMDARKAVAISAAMTLRRDVGRRECARRSIALREQMRHTLDKISQ